MKHKFLISSKHIKIFFRLVNEQQKHDNIFKITPLNAGFTIHIFMGPRLANWPNESSRKNKGTPIRAKETKYGIRKAPVKQFIIVKKFVKVFRD